MFIKAFFLYFFYIVWVYKSICIMSIFLSFFLSLFSVLFPSVFYGLLTTPIYTKIPTLPSRKTHRRAVTALFPRTLVIASSPMHLPLLLTNGFCSGWMAVWVPVVSDHPGSTILSFQNQLSGKLVTWLYFWTVSLRNSLPNWSALTWKSDAFHFCVYPQNVTFLMTNS